VTGLDPVELEILRTQLESVAEEMGDVLIQGAYSPNITERRDCSTAIFDAQGRLVAQAEHIPGHLGAMPDSVDAVLAQDPDPGDVWLLNDPFAGGTHLPDLTLVSTVSPGREATGGVVQDDEIVGFAVSRAHHADVGGSSPGSMPADSTEVVAEGIRLPPVRLVADGETQTDVEDLVLANVRNPGERRADLRAQRAANDRGEDRLGDLLADHGERLLQAFAAVRDYSRERVESELADLPDGEYTARDVLEGDGVTQADIPICVHIKISGSQIAIDFSGTADQVAGNLNAPMSVTRSGVYYVLRCLTDPEIPPNAGCYEPMSVDAPEGSLLNPTPPVAVVGGNVETCQRVADVCFAALSEAAPERVPAGGQGTMNNVIIGTDQYAYYETIGGGAGATALADGLSGVQVGLTNTRNTPVEALEGTYPIRVERYALRDGSGGDGARRGGDGLVRTFRLETESTLSLLTERRRHAPRGMNGGADGMPGCNLIDGESVSAKVTREVPAGTLVDVMTPGGGGHGAPESGDR
jgi:N-methylhydantoinase B